MASRKMFKTSLSWSNYLWVFAVEPKPRPDIMRGITSRGSISPYETYNARSYVIVTVDSPLARTLGVSIPDIPVIQAILDMGFRNDKKSSHYPGHHYIPGLRVERIGEQRAHQIVSEPERFFRQDVIEFYKERGITLDQMVIELLQPMESYELPISFELPRYHKLGPEWTHLE
jgi:hypothetical protein